MKKIILLTVLICSIAFSGCNKDQSLQDIARFMFVNTIPDASSTDCLVDGLEANLIPINFGSNSNYWSITPGVRKIKINWYNNLNQMNELTTQDIAFTGSGVGSGVLKNHTLLLHGTTAAPKFLLVEDVLTAPPVGKALIRVIHASPDAPSVNVFNGTAASPLFPAASEFGTINGFISVDATLVGTSYSLQIRNASTNAVIRTQAFTAASGKIYTLLIRGLVTANPLFPANTITSGVYANN